MAMLTGDSFLIETMNLKLDLEKNDIFLDIMLHQQILITHHHFID
jgi:hypothetical protein